MSKRVTMVFEFDVRSLPENPFHIETPFGRPVVISDGDLPAEYDELMNRITDALYPSARAGRNGASGR